MKLFNTLSMKKEEFIPLVPGKVTMYACGPTVYNFIHIGNARPIIIFDALRRYLEYRGFEVTFVQNFTDIDDKIINRAAEEGIPFSEVAAKYTSEYIADAAALGVRPATIHPKATENIDAIINLVSALLTKGFAYQNGGDVYFRTSKFPEYGKLSHQPLEELQAGARVEQTVSKENPMDFVLWKAAKLGEPSWVSPWGPGRPGWHIECSAMAGRFLGDTIDIHCGGQDLIFPHHENEIAQSEAASGLNFVRYWVHNGFISIDNKKMSKSLGNFFTVRDAAKVYGYENIRMFMLMSHYRSPLNYSGDILIQSQNALERLKTAKANLEFIRDNGSDELKPGENGLITSLSNYKIRFCDALDDDFNTADAIAVIFELVREANTAASSDRRPSKHLANSVLSVLCELADVLGLFYCLEDADLPLEAEVEALIMARQEARKEKNWPEADRIRDKLKDLGIILEDTPQGVKWKKA